MPPVNLRVATMLVIEREHHRRLLLMRGGGMQFPWKWCMPGGKVEGVESPLLAAVRELREETGIQTKVDKVAVLGVTRHHSPQSPSGVIEFLTFAVEIPRRVPIRLEPGFAACGWFSASEATNLGRGAVLEPFWQDAERWRRLAQPDKPTGV